jgi:hypothetical protein
LPNLDWPWVNLVLVAVHHLLASLASDCARPAA